MNDGTQAREGSCLLSLENVWTKLISCEESLTKIFIKTLERRILPLTPRGWNFVDEVTEWKFNELRGC
ncbi:MAG: hypothetical protein ACTS43_01060 [Candidatus Hodgkinia cicadicola]